jgi:phosphoribosylformylglycinamidine (FGAM) synthase-like amidotransferase family enzyme
MLPVLLNRSLGVCNGCQLMALLGWVPGSGLSADPLLPSQEQPRFLENDSGRWVAFPAAASADPQRDIAIPCCDGVV